MSDFNIIHMETETPEAPEAPNEPNELSESMMIEQNNTKFILNIKIIGNSLSLNIFENEEINNEYYTKSMTLNEIKGFHNVFSGLNSCNEFLDYIKALILVNKLTINKNKNKVTINISADYLFKQYNIKIPLLYKKKNLEEIVNIVCKELLLNKEKIKYIEENLNKKIKESIDNEMKILKEENQKLKEKIENQDNEIKELKQLINEIKKSSNNKNEVFNMIYNNSVIIQKNEFGIIYAALKIRINKEIKEIKKLYQASIDGGEPYNFHNKCDNIPNTLVLIKSAGNRRFGGFASETWESTSSIDKEDKNVFLFSLDKQKIYCYKNEGKTISCFKNRGPIFGNGYTIKIEGNPLKEKKLYTNESSNKSNFEFRGDKNALSEDGEKKFIYAIDYEVFQIIFE